MNDREFDEIMHKYVESTKLDKDIAFKKLKNNSDSIKKTQIKYKPKIAFAAMLCTIIVVLSITLPLTLIKDYQDITKYYGSDDISYSIVEDENVLINEYRIRANFPKVKADTVNIISSNSDGVLNGAALEYFVYDEIIFNAEFIAISKNCILQNYDKYFDYTLVQKWNDFELKYFYKFNDNTLFYNVNIYFTDGAYNYFLTVESEEDLQPNEILDFLYK
ncbi:MAG: hypothetical protein HFE29_01750 [Clostridia bacterium]|jgi:hypothetical protein|nr:hypothetical protein [Clostridia bacterium]